MQELKKNIYDPGKKFINVCMMLIIFFSSMGLIFYRVIKDNDDFVRSFFVQVITLVALMAYVFYKRNLSFKKTRLNTAIIAFIVCSALSLFATINFYESFSWLLKYIIYVLIFFLTVSTFQKKDAENVFIFIVIMGFVMSAIGLLQYFGYDWFRFLYSTPASSRVFSILGNPDFLGGYLSLIFPLSAALFLSNGLKNKKGVFALVSSAIILLCLFLTATRSAIVAFTGSFAILSAIVLFQKNAEPKKRWFVSFIALIAIVFLLGISGQGNIKGIFKRFSTIINAQELKTDSSAQYRLSLWRTSIAMFKVHPIFGVGLGTFKLHYPIFQAREKRAGNVLSSLPTQESRVHNEYLQILSETGIIGFAAFLWLIFSVLAAGVKYISSEKETKNKFFIIGLYCAIVAMFFDSIFAFPFRLTSHTTFFWIFLALMAVCGEHIDQPNTVSEKQKNVRAKKTNNYSREIIMSVWIISSVIILFLSRSFFGTISYKQAVLDSNQGRDDKAFENYVRALKFSPYDPEIHFTWGYICLKNNNTEEALREFMLVEKLYPNNEDNLLNLGFVYNQKRMPQQALVYLNRAVEIDPEFAQGYANIAGIYLNYFSDSPWAKEQAIQSLEKASELEIDNQNYKTILERIKK